LKLNDRILVPQGLAAFNTSWISAIAASLVRAPAEWPGGSMAMDRRNCSISHGSIIEP
jgi:hypothetical protein